MTFILKFRNTIISVSVSNYFQIQTAHNHLNNNNINIKSQLQEKKQFANLIIVREFYYFCTLNYTCTMNIEFQNKGLEDLYFFGSTEEKTYS